MAAVFQATMDASNSDDPVCLLIEILSGKDLLIRDKRAKSSDPYIKVKLDGKDLHQTKVISKTLNPIYTEAQHNAFILDCSAKELFDHQGLLFKVKDHKMLSSDEDMGSIQVPAMDLYKATGEVMEFVLVPPSDHRGQNVGGITLRCWPATEAHVKKYGSNKKGLAGFMKKAEERAKERAKIISSRYQEIGKELGTVTKDISQAMSLKKENDKDDSSRAAFDEDMEASQKKPTQKPIFPIDSPRSSPPKRNAPKTKSIMSDSFREADKEEAAATPTGAHIMDHHKIAIEVVAGNDIAIGDSHSSDPYVKIMLGDKEVHKTKHLTKTLNPVWTPELDSTFILDCTDANLSDKKGLEFILKDMDMIGKNVELGRVRVPYTTLVKGDGEPMEFTVDPPKGKYRAGSLLLRCRPATPKDEETMMNKKNTKTIFSTTSQEAAAEAWGSTKEAEPVAADVPDLKPIPAEPKAAAAPIKAVKQPKQGEELHLRIDIVSCRNLISADKNGLSDPYVKLSMANKELHKTKHILKTLNPLFADHDNVFTLHCPAKELFDAGGLGFKVKDWDRIGKNDDLGHVEVPASQIYNNMHGDDMELKITPPKGKENDDAGYLTIRCSSTTSEDHTGEKKTFLGMKVPEIKAPNITVPRLSFHKEKSLEIDENEDEQAMFIQIVSCRDLIVADKTGYSDPYVKVKMGKKDLHETKPVMQNLNPVFGGGQNPFFVMEARPSEVRANGGVTFKVKDWDRVGANDDLGSATVDAETFLKCEGGNMELKLTPPKGIGEAAGFVTVRIRPATDSDMASRKSMFGGLSAQLALTDYGKVDTHLLIEVVSAWKVPIADLNSSDPYVKVKIGPRTVHGTKPIKNTRDPIYTIKHNSVFILDCAKKELTDNNGLTFKVKDHDLVGSNDDLGEVTVPHEKILEATGERQEHELKHGDNDAGWLAIRVRPVTAWEREFLKNMKKKSKGDDFLGLRKSYDKTMKPLGGTGNRLKNLMTKKVKEVDGVKQFRVRPYPDPERKEETEFMSEKAIELEAFKPSKRWLDIGSGGLGKVYVEILGCDGLPNKDHDFGGGNKTDPFVAVVYEDSIVKTDIIDDSLSPRWLPWMQRAFIFRMIHTSSSLNIGVFDFDPGFVADHDICGRVSIDLANFQADTEYVLRYNIFENSSMVDRQPKGILMIRLRMELQEERNLILSNLQMPPEFFVNVKEGKDFDLVRQTVGGRQDLQSYSQKTIHLLVDELMGYSVLKYYFKDSIKAILLWRGQVRVYGVWLPLHSLAFFLAGITLAERPSLYPSYFFFGIAWSLYAVQAWRNNNINPWYKTKTFVGLTQEILTGTSFDGPHWKIAAHEKEKEAKEEEETQKARIEKARKEQEDYQNAQMALLEEHETMMASVGDQSADTDISSRRGKVSIDPLKFILYPIQLYLQMACNSLRLVKNVLIWDEPYIAYIITLASVAIGIVFLFVPWAFLVRWTSRILAWLLLGPHMKLVDIYWYRNIENMTEEEQRVQIQEALAAEFESAKYYADQARIVRENAVKLKQLKTELYGSFITKVPVLRNERFADIPLHSSTATPYKPPENLPPVNIERVPGQHLVGTMIPRVPEEDVEIGKPKDEEAKKKD